MNRLRFRKFLKLPVRWKSTVYLVEDGRIEPFVVEDYDIDFEPTTGEVYADVILRHKTDKYTIFCPEDDFGRIVFNRRSAALRALQRGRREQH